MNAFEFMRSAYLQWCVDTQVSTYDVVRIRIKCSYLQQVKHCLESRYGLWTQDNRNIYFMGNLLVIDDSLDCDFKIYKESNNGEYTFERTKG